MSKPLILLNLNNLGVIRSGPHVSFYNTINAGNHPRLPAFFVSRPP